MRSHWKRRKDTCHLQVFLWCPTMPQESIVSICQYLWTTPIDLPTFLWPILNQCCPNNSKGTSICCRLTVGMVAGVVKSREGSPPLSGADVSHGDDLMILMTWRPTRGLASYLYPMCALERSREPHEWMAQDGWQISIFQVAGMVMAG